MNRTALFHPVFVYPLFALVIVTRGLSSAELAAEQSEEDGAVCQLDINGGHIEKLELLNKTGRVFEFDHPGSSVTLPAGQYRVRRVGLKGGFVGFGQMTADDIWFTLEPDKPHELKVGAPLTLGVEATRRGSCLTLDYALNDASGRKYVDAQSAELPAFAIYSGDKKVGSGSFEYG